MEKKKILYVSNEISPFTTETEMSSICHDMLALMQEQTHEIRVFMPKWGPINERKNQLHEVIRLSGMNLIIDDTDHPLIIKVASLPLTRLQVYFIDNDDYFQNRRFETDKDGNEYPDNDERSIFFARGVLETVKKLRWNPDIIHCHGWATSMIPLYLKTAFKDEPAYRETKVVTSFYEPQLKTCFHDNLGFLLENKDFKSEDLGQIEHPITEIQVLKKAAEYSDGVIIEKKASPIMLKYAVENDYKMISPDDAKDTSKLEEFYESLF